MQWLQENWFWLAVTIVFVWVHMKHGHGGHGGHGGHHHGGGGPGDADNGNGDRHAEH